MAEMLIELHAVSRAFRRGAETVKALDSVSCSVVAGDRIAVVGRSGSGKSTLLHLMGGLDEPTAGTVSWPALGPRDTLRPKNIALVFQSPSLLPTLSVAENVALPLLIASIPAGEAAASVAEALERLDLFELADKLPEELSGGQAQRVAFARALAVRPRVILADEPTGQLDRATADRFLDHIMESIEGTTAALVLATHDPAVARRMSERWPMEHGLLDAAR
jgi:ABC-type lipoprotein export system ATPase subunit